MKKENMAILKLETYPEIKKLLQEISAGLAKEPLKALPPVRPAVTVLSSSANIISTK